ncbi:uncharacterized protein LOC143282329 isoform X2 [Babylonia areolata]|uniref:uncharacterized protein LOC143282329 isoform X2 n=1 Tax=Babylonia areolata TaxID=304850 RepID=UPI003FD57EDD
MPIQIRVVIPDASPAPEESAAGVRGNGDTAEKSVPRRKVPCAVKSRRRDQVHRWRPTSAPVARKTPIKLHDVTMHVASIYDVDNEHSYIMGKALQAYHQHRQSEEEEKPTTQERPLSISPNHNRHNNHAHHHHNNNHQQRRRRWLSSSSGINEGVSHSASSPRSSSSSSNSSSLSERQRRGFKLALCTLRDPLGKDLGPAPHSHSTPTQGARPVQRPWSAAAAFSSHGRLDAIREVSLANCVQESSSSSSRGVQKAKPVHQHRLHVRTVPLPSRMDPSFTSRGSSSSSTTTTTTQAWSPDDLHPGSRDCMTMSCPSPRSLEEHVRSARTHHVPRDPNPSPVVVKGRGALLASPSSPQPRDRPSSACSYDGGLFLSVAGGGSGGGRDYFLVNPDWVGEAMTVQKLSLNERQSRPGSRASVLASSARGKEGEEEMEEGGGRRSRRCKSAPPTKNRSRITWSS